jgi:hypothetical protein
MPALLADTLARRWAWIAVQQFSGYVWVARVARVAASSLPPCFLVAYVGQMICGSCA